MEYLPIVIFEIVISVFIAFAVFAEILLKQTIKQREKIKELYEQIKLRDMNLQELVRSNNENVRNELRKWLWMMRKYGCQTINEFENMIEDLANRPQQELDELKADAELTGRELRKWNALARNFGCFNQSELYMMVESMKNQVDFMCKRRNAADPQYVDEWFKFKKMF